MIDGKVKEWVENGSLRGCSGKFVAILAYLVGAEPVTDPYVTGMTVTSDGYVLLATNQDPLYSGFLGSKEDLLNNIRRLCEVGVPDAERDQIIAKVEARQHSFS